MELRKVQRTGGTSLSVILPKSWATHAGLAPGDIVGCVEQGDGSLGIRPHVQDDRELRTVELPPGGHAPRLLFRRIVSAYLVGYDRLSIRSSSPLNAGTRRTARDAADRIVGLEVVEETERSLVLQDLLDPQELPARRALRRMDLLARALHSEAADVLRDPDHLLPPTLDEREEEVDRLAWLVTRQAHGFLQDTSQADQQNLHPSESLHHVLAARVLERASDHAMRMATAARALPADDATLDVRGRLAGGSEVASDLLERAVATYHGADEVEAHETIEDADTLRGDVPDLLRGAASIEGDAGLQLLRIGESLGRTAALAADLAELALNHAVDVPDRSPDGGD